MNVRNWAGNYAYRAVRLHEPETVEQDCGAGGVCYLGSCAPDCSGGRECPGGFECVPFVNDAQQVVAWRCFTYCWLYDDYDPGSFLRPPDQTPAIPADAPAAPIYPGAVGLRP